ncbi:beta-glucosidase family protein [Cupriavidus sp. D39]|uniref:beta-glucosidase family protein n=1 Tax=Cupriavidus sp. D39 TaxID=2997877 RepID=UPI00226D4BBF|nr:beta-glucosidase [Cupriavidus sp. D39]MCY0854094.1 beta-glucosidase [Cupriavidus sp. D39]
MPDRLHSTMDSLPPVLSADSRAATHEDPDQRARDTEARMTDDERFSMLYSLMVRVFGRSTREPRVPPELPVIAGYTRGVPRLDIPALRLADASLGLRHTGGPDDVATAFPAGLAFGASFNPELVRVVGSLIGKEARARDFNVALGGGINLVRDVRNGRNFEYISEDPLLSGLMGAAMVCGTQEQGVIAVLKHVSLNATETNKFFLDAIIDPAAHRESDLLAFQIAIEKSEPGALMGAYNLINGVYACGNRTILQETVKDAMGFKGWVMSDWLAVYGWEFALHGLDQHSGAQLDAQEWFTGPLRQAYAKGKVPKARISEMVRRMLRSYYAVGIDRHSPAAPVDFTAHHAVALEAARQGIVLLKNEAQALPLAPGKQRIAVIGGYAQTGVLSGDGSSQVMPPGGYAAQVPSSSHPLLGPTTLRLFGPSPLSELRKRLPNTLVEFDSGAHIAGALALAQRADVVIVHAIRHEGERFDSPDMTLPFGQDALIDALASAHPNVIVVLQTGNPVAMPWHGKVRAIVQAWFPGQAGAQAIAEMLAGEVNPSGRLPVTFPASLEQTPHPALPGAEVELGTPIQVRYHEGAEVGYRWFAKTDQRPLFSFGHGLSYTSFAYADLQVSVDETVTASFTVTNTGTRTGADVPQVYLTEAAGECRTRLLGFQRVSLRPGESCRVSVRADPRLLARFQAAQACWRIDPGRYRLALGHSAGELVLHADASLKGQDFGR